MVWRGEEDENNWMRSQENPLEEGNWAGELNSALSAFV
jgi:hypothetical protein